VRELGPKSAFIFRITHVDNVAWILRNGLHCRSSTIQDPDFVEIGSPELIAKRKVRFVPVGPRGSFNDYIPFYFTPWSIMARKINTGHGGIQRRDNREIAVIVSSLHKLSKMRIPFVFTNGHAVATETDWFEDLDDLDEISWDQLRNRDFKGDPEKPDKLNRYQAEAMVHRRVPIEALDGIACYEDAVKRRFDASAEAAGVKAHIKVLPRWYF
jgi:hypothetical protein